MESANPQAGQAQVAAPSQDDRIWAAVAHGSAFVVFFGPIVPVIIWLTQRKKSTYVAFHSLQAMLYQSLFFWTWVLLIPLLILFVVGVMVLGLIVLQPHGGNQDLFGLLSQLMIWVGMIGTFLVYVGIGAWGAIACLTGHEFRYPFFGAQMARLLEYTGQGTTSLPPDKEDRVVGAVCHSTSAVQLWGLITPTLVWATQRERSQALRFQALQALVYQGLGLIAAIVSFGLYFVTVVVSMVMFLGASNSSQPGLWMGLGFLPVVLLWCCFAIGGPAYQVLAFVGAVRVLNGHDFHYPILGRILAARLNPEAK